VNWTDWVGDDLIIPSKPYDEQFAHKSCLELLYASSLRPFVPFTDLVDAPNPYGNPWI
jgi:hypothetical protein